MKMKKLFPPHLGQLVFLNLDGEIEKINGLDYDILIWLIYQTHKHYHQYKETTVEFEYSKIKESLSSNPNTKSIQSSLKKINELQLLSNYLLSYENKEMILTKPFDIEIITSENGKSYGFSVTTKSKFMSRFDNPTPKVEVDYTIIYNLNKMSKLLYLLLKDALGVYESKSRNIDITPLRHMMNISNEETSNSNFMTQLKKSIVEINENTDITIEYKTVKKRDLKNGVSVIVKVKFTIKKDEHKLLKKRVNKNKSTDDTQTEIIYETLTDAEPVTQTFDKYIDELVETQYQNALSNGIEIKNPKGYKKGIRDNLLKDKEIQSQFELVNFLENEKSKLRPTITDNQPYMLVFTDGENERNSFFINEKYQFVNCVSGEVQTEFISETLDSIYDNLGNLYFDIQRCDYTKKYDVGRL